MYSEEKKSKSYGSIFVYCFFCFVLIVEVARFAKPYINVQNLIETEAVVEEGFMAVGNSGNLPCGLSKPSSASVRAHDQQKLSQAVTSDTRSRPPNSYCVKFQSFATMAKQLKENGGKYESRPFSVGGYNWTFLIYPVIYIPTDSGAYVSVYVRIDNSTLITNPKDVYAEITFLAYKSSLDKYQINQETEAQRFHLFKQQWGLLQFLPIYYFENSGYGYSFDGDSVVFGVDINIVKPFENWEVFSNEQNIRDPIFEWRLTKYSTRFLDSYTSDPFSSGGRSWSLKVYPNGVGNATGNSLSLYLLSDQSTDKGYLEAKLQITDQIQSNHFVKKVAAWPNATENGWGFDRFMSFSDLRNASKGYLVNDTLKFQVQILSFSKTDYYSHKSSVALPISNGDST
ncbi:putative ubiquitinyl hydrolase 1 [Arabidopsis thaliana]|uniref:ZW9 n=2 Tax=Arabidopsis TaxID=3701 RepID=A0A178WML2_ARATH|nr:MATH/TRAF domain [Arabidopsis thaliana x Arabidopsis arenosa]OAP19151.1 ZW9 [Arabidopsis thaliana]